jgi:hypothetical protein
MQERRERHKFRLLRNENNNGSMGEEVVNKYMGREG